MSGYIKSQFAILELTRLRGDECRSGAQLLEFCFFFFKAEDGIRVWSVTGVQTCALPIYAAGGAAGSHLVELNSQVRSRSTACRMRLLDRTLCSRDSRFLSGSSSVRRSSNAGCSQIGRAACRERVEVRERAQARRKHADGKGVGKEGRQRHCAYVRVET